MKKIASMLFAFAVILMFGAVAHANSEASASIFSETFESRALGSLDGQSGWTATSGVTVVPDYDAKNDTTSTEGVQGMLISDTSTSYTESAESDINVMASGTASLDFKPAHVSSYLRIVFRDTSAYIVHFVLKDGQFYYFDETNTETATGVGYTAGTWYNLTVTFNGEKKTYDLTVAQSNGTVVVSLANVGYTNTAADFVQRVQFVTAGSRTGDIYIDNIQTTVARSTFEEHAETLTLGNLSGQRSWSMTGSGFEAIDSTVRSGGQAIRLVSDGSTDNRLLHDFSATQSGTIEVWMRAAQSNRKFGLHGLSNNQNAIALGFDSTGHFYYRNGSSEPTTTASYNANTWYKFQVTFNGTILRHYYDLKVFDQSGNEIVSLDNLKPNFASTSTSKIDRLQFRNPAGDNGTFYADDVQVSLNEYSTRDSFEGYLAQPLNGQGEWTASSDVSITETLSKSGARSLVIDDQNTGVKSAARDIVPMKSGFLSFWVRADQTTSTLQFKGQSGSTDAFLVSLATGGAFGYLDGSTDETIASYSAGEWYRLFIAFDTYEDTYDFRIYNAAGTLIDNVRDAAFSNAAAVIDGFSVSTLSTETGVYYVDDVAVEHGGGLQQKEVFDKLNKRFNDGQWFSGQNETFATYGRDKAETSVYKQGFETLTVGALDGQGGWIANTGATVESAMSHVKQGVRSMKISDGSTTSAVSAEHHGVGTVSAGRISLDVKPMQSTSYLRIIFRDDAGYLVHFIIKNGEFYYFDGTNTEIATGVGYTAGEWYKVQVDFDGERRLYDLSVIDSSGVVFSVLDLDYINSQAEFVERVQLVTSGLSTGDFYIDNIEAIASGEAFHEYFDTLSIGSLSGQRSWNVTGLGIDVVSSPVRSGSGALKLEDAGTQQQLAFHNFPNNRAGSMEVWMRAAQTTGQVGMQSYAGANKLFEAGFGSGGNFYYEDDAGQTSTTASYSAGVWYRFVIDFDGDMAQYNLRIFDASESLVVEQFNVNFVSSFTDNTTMSARIFKPSSSAGIFYIDELIVPLCKCLRTFDFENTAVGALTGDWSGTSGATVSAAESQSGNHALRIEDQSASKESAEAAIPDRTQGQVEWWALAEQTNKKLYMFGLTETDKTAWRIGFNTNGKWLYSDGNAAIAAESDPYSADTWYRFKVLFDNAKRIYHFYVFDEDGKVVFAQRDLAFDEGADSYVSGVRFDTHSTEQNAVFYVDAIRVSDVNPNLKFPDNGGTQAWGTGATVWPGLNAMFLSVKDTDSVAAFDYLNFLISQTNAILDQRPSVTGEVDYKSKSDPVWNYNGDLMESRKTLYDSERNPTLLVDSTMRATTTSGTAGTIIGRDAPYIQITTSAGSVSGTFKLTVKQNFSTRRYLQEYDNLTMDPLDADYVVTRINGIDDYVTVTDLNSPSVDPNPIPWSGTMDTLLGATGEMFLIPSAMLETALNIMDNPSYRDTLYPGNDESMTYGDYAKRYIEASEQFVAIFEDVIQPHSGDPNAAVFVQPLGFPSWTDGLSEPHNKQTHAATAFLRLYLATGDGDYLDMASKLYRHLKNDFSIHPTYDTYYWTYFPTDSPAYTGWTTPGVSENTYTFSGYKSLDNLAYGSKELREMYHAYANGVVFDNGDRDRFLRLIRELFPKPNGQFANSVNGTGNTANGTQYMNNMYWADLDNTGTIYSVTKNVLDLYDHRPFYWHLFGSGLLKKYQ